MKIQIRLLGKLEKYHYVEIITLTASSLTIDSSEYTNDEAFIKKMIINQSHIEILIREI